MKLVNENKDFVPAPAGLHKAVCVDIVDLGMQKGFGDKMQHKVRFYFELPDALMEDGRPFIVVRMFTATLAETGHLNPFLSKWRGGIQIKEGEAIDLDDFLLKSASIFISHNIKESGKTYANIDLAMPCNERVRPSGYYKRNDPIQPKQSGSAAQRPTPMAAASGVTAGRTAFPSQPPADPLPTTAELAPKLATEEQKAKFLKVLEPLRENAAKYFYALGAIGKEQPLEELPLSYCPATKTQFDNVMGSIQAFVDAQVSVTKTEDPDFVPF